MTMAQRNGLLVGLALMSCGLLIYDIRLRSSWSSGNITAALGPERETLQRAVPKKECNLTTVTPTFDQFFNFVDEKTPCDSMKMFGGTAENPNADGAKAVCMDPKLAPRERGCVVLSFGINNEWGFDDAMEKQGCRVYAFDPFMGKEDHTRGQNILFFKLGLAGKKNTATSGPMNNLRGILERFALLGTDIDYLKIDIEGAEKDFFKNVLYEDREILTRVKQIGMEIHNGMLNTFLRDQFWKYIHQLRCLGFRQVSSEANIVGRNPFLSGSRKVSHCYELVWINEAYL